MNLIKEFLKVINDARLEASTNIIKENIIKANPEKFFGIKEEKT